MGRCKICHLPDVLKAKIEQSMDAGLGPTKICNAFPEAELNEGNVYSHKKHYRVTQASKAYDIMLEQKVTAQVKKEEAVTNTISEMPEEDGEQSPSIIVTPPKPEGTAHLPVAIETMLSTGTTGNRVLDSIAVLDLIISQGEHLLETATLKDVLDAIRLKHQLLGDVDKPEDKAQKTEIMIGQVLVQLAKEEQESKLHQSPETILVGEVIDDDEDEP